MIRVLQLAHCAEQPWKNGGGTTRELLAWPTAADWALRLSVARIASDGPFSAYPGISRWFTVLSGDGVELRWQERVVHLSPADAPLHFDGGDAPGCRLLGGPTEDLNLMLRQGRAQGRLLRAEGGVPLAAHARWRALYAAQACTLFAPVPQALPAHCLAWDDQAEAGSWLVEAAQGHDPAAPLQAWWIEAHLEHPHP